MGDVDWRIWRVIIAGKATLKEIDDHWSINDLMDAHDAIDIDIEIGELSKKEGQ